MAYVSDNKVNLGSQYDYDDAVREIASLVNVGTREDGKYHLADLCNGNVKIGARNKPVRHTTTSNITDAQRQSVNFGMLMKDQETIRKSWIRADDGVSGGAAFTTDNPTKWEYLRPRGGSVSPTEYHRLKDFDGYNHSAAPTMSVANAKYSADINDKVLNINAKISDESSTNLGSYYNVEIMMKEFNVESSFPEINQDTYRNILGGNWRYGVAIQVPQSSNTYRYLILSTVSPIEIYNTGAGIDVVNRHNLDMSEPVFQYRLKRIARGWGIKSFKCVPFLGCDLKYNTTWGWYWGATSVEKAITFPNADTFTLNVGGFTENIVSAVSSYSITVDGTTLGVVASTPEGVILSMPRSVAQTATNATITIKFKLSTAFGKLSNIKGGLYSDVAPTSLTGYEVNGSQAIGWAIDAETEWENVDREYTAVISDVNLAAAIKATSSQSTQLSIGNDLKIEATNIVRTAVGNDTKDILARVPVIGIQFT